MSIFFIKKEMQCKKEKRNNVTPSKPWKANGT